MTKVSNTKRGQVSPLNLAPGRSFRRLTTIPISAAILALIICAIVVFGLRPVPRPGDDDVVAVSFSADGKELLAGTRLGEVLLWSAGGAAAAPFHPSQKRLQPYLPLPFNSLILHPSGQYAAVAATSLSLVSTGDINQLSKLSVPPGAYGGLTFSPDGRQLSAANSSERLLLWNVAGPASRPVDLGPADAGVYGATAFSPDGKTLVSAGHTVRLIDLQTLKELWRRPRDNYAFLCAAFSPDGAKIVAGSQDTTIHVWDALTGALSVRLHGHSGYVEAVAFSPDGKTIASYGGKEVNLWNISTGARVALGNAAGGVAFSPDGRWIASGGPHRTIFLWETAPAHKKEILDWESPARAQDEKR